MTCVGTYLGELSIQSSRFAFVSVEVKKQKFCFCILDECQIIRITMNQMFGQNNSEIMTYCVIHWTPKPVSQLLVNIMIQLLHI